MCRGDEEVKVLIATPAFGGMITTQYTNCLLATLAKLREAKIDHVTYFLSNESLIPRARNKCAKYAIANGFTDLFFIDADMVWEPEWFMKILLSNRDVHGGTYPVKALPLRLNFNAMSYQLDDWSADRSVEQYVRFIRKYADENGEVIVRHLPTGFLKIKTRALTHMIATDRVQSYHSGGETFYDFFPAGTRNGEYESEDWGFCRLAGEFLPIVLQTEAVCGHTGTFHYGIE